MNTEPASLLPLDIIYITGGEYERAAAKALGIRFLPANDERFSDGKLRRLRFSYVRIETSGANPLLHHVWDNRYRIKKLPTSVKRAANYCLEENPELVVINYPGKKGVEIARRLVHGVVQ